MVAAIGAVLVCLCAAPVALAANQIYWSNWSDVPPGGTGGTVAFANLDGSGGGGQLNTTGATPGGPAGAAIDLATGKIYWANYSNSTISYANLNGSGGGGQLNTTGATAAEPWGLAIDSSAGRIYWANNYSDTAPISYANLDGSGGGDLPTTGATANGPSGVAIDPAAGKIYWTNASSSTAPISYANLNGSGGGNLPTTGATTDDAEGLAIDAATGKIYWANNDNDTISFANLDGSGGGGQLNTTGATPDGPEGVAVDPGAGRIYWGNDDSTTIPISYANLDGSGGGDLLTTGATANDPQEPVLLETPAAAGVPAVMGGTAQGSTLSCSKGSWGADLLESQLYRAPQSFTYGWTLNGSPIAGATSSTIDASAGGQYACDVTAVNYAGSATQKSAPHSVFPTKPKITKSKINRKHHTAKFTFKATGASGFQCALIKQPKKRKKHPKPHFSHCSSPKTYKHLKAGKYTFEVRALNAAGGGLPASKHFKIA